MCYKFYAVDVPQNLCLLVKQRIFLVCARVEDVRGAQSLVGYIYPFLFIPSILLMYLNVNPLPLCMDTVLSAIPYSHPIITSKVNIISDY